MPIEDSHERGKRLLQRIAQAASRRHDAGVGFTVKTLNDMKIVFGRAHNAPQIDVFWASREAHASAPAALAFNKARLGQRLDNFVQVIARDGVAARDILDRMHIVRLQREQHQQPERIVGMQCQTQRNQPSNIVGAHSDNHAPRLKSAYQILFCPE